MTRALLITNDFPPMGGGEATCYARICASVPPDRIVVLAPRMAGDQAFDQAQAYRVIRRSAPTNPHPVARLLQIALLFVRALRMIRSESIDIVHIGHLHLGPIGLGLQRWRGVPYVLYLHGGEMAAYLRFRPIRAIARAIVEGAVVVVVNSAFTRQHYSALGIRPARVETLTISPGTAQFGPDDQGRRIRAKYRLGDDKVILTVGRLIERKGHDVVIRSLDRIRQTVGPVRYVIAGRGPEEMRLRALARALGCEDTVHFIGYVPSEELPALYAACNVFVMPSRVLTQRDGVEGFGIVFLEAAAASKPVVGGRSGGIPEVVLDNVTGRLVDPGDVDQLTEALVQLLLDRHEAGRLGANGRRHAEAVEAAWSATLRRIWDEPVRAG
ncbi:MAG TPA: glycosyltransferase family 4 protein [bacterium]|nr:glycosyltransferase family 4 protein [bacterium]